MTWEAAEEIERKNFRSPSPGKKYLGLFVGKNVERTCRGKKFIQNKGFLEKKLMVVP